MSATIEDPGPFSPSFAMGATGLDPWEDRPHPSYDRKKTPEERIEDLERKVRDLKYNRSGCAPMIAFLFLAISYFWFC